MTQQDQRITEAYPYIMSINTLVVHKPTCKYVTHKGFGGWHGSAYAVTIQELIDNWGRPKRHVTLCKVCLP